MSFVLQQNANPESTNWIDVFPAPALNFTNLRYELTMSAAHARCLYRLTSR